MKKQSATDNRRHKETNGREAKKQKHPHERTSLQLTKAGLVKQIEGDQRRTEALQWKSFQSAMGGSGKQNGQAKKTETLPWENQSATDHGRLRKKQREAKKTEATIKEPVCN